jgi:hypothetical protein
MFMVETGIRVFQVNPKIVASIRRLRSISQMISTLSPLRGYGLTFHAAISRIENEFPVLGHEKTRG